MILQGRNIVVVGQQSWDINLGSNCKDIARELAKNNKVLYVNVPLPRNHYLKRHQSFTNLRRIAVLKGRVAGLAEVEPQLWSFYPKVIVESINWISLPFVYDFFNKRNATNIANEIKRIAKELNFDNYILFNDSSMFQGHYYKELLDPELYIYYIRDNFIAQDYFKKHGTRLEKKTIEKADLVVTNSIYLKDYAKKYQVNSFYIGQGCDLSQFKLKDISEPEDMAGIKGVKIGYVGFLTAMRLNIQLLVELAELRPEWQIVLVGPEDQEFAQSKLHGLKNVHFLGHKNLLDLPSYVQYFDVCINPQEVNDLTIGNYPRKIDEYLAMGKPTVATQTRTMEFFKDHVYLGENSSDYEKLILQALEEDNELKQKGRMNFAHEHTWENNILEIEKAMKFIQH